MKFGKRFALVIRIGYVFRRLIRYFVDILGLIGVVLNIKDFFFLFPIHNREKHCQAKMNPNQSELCDRC